MRISDEVSEVLKCARVECNAVFLPMTLPRKLYLDVNKVLEGIGGKWDRKAKGHVFADDLDVQAAVDNAVETGEWIDMKKEMQFFETPAGVVDCMIQCMPLKNGAHVLEPSAGRGAIAFNLPFHHLSIDCIELDPKNVAYMQEHVPNNGNCFDIGHADFLQLHPNAMRNTPNGLWLPENYDLVVMNPPFSKNQDIKHVLHAWQFLKKGGVLVAIMSSGAVQNTRKINDEFRDFLATNRGEWNLLADGAFKESGTGVRTILVNVTK